MRSELTLQHLFHRPSLFPFYLINYSRELHSGVHVVEKLCQLNFHITKPDLIPFALLPPFFVVGLKEVAFLTATFYYKFNRTQIYADTRRNKKRRYAHSAKR